MNRGITNYCPMNVNLIRQLCFISQLIQWWGIALTRHNNCRKCSYRNRLGTYMESLKNPYCMVLHWVIACYIHKHFCHQQGSFELRDKQLTYLSLSHIYSKRNRCRSFRSLKSDQKRHFAHSFARKAQEWNRHGQFLFSRGTRKQTPFIHSDINIWYTPVPLSPVHPSIIQLRRSF